MEKNTPKSNLRGIAFALAALTATSPSWAHAEPQAPSVEVHFDDLNLNSEAGIKALDRRLDRAVEQVCSESSIQSLRATRAVERCREETRNALQAQRELAIATATGHATDGLADNARRGSAQVTRAD